MFKKYLYIIIPVIATAVSSLLLFTSMDWKVADWFQRTLPSTKEDQNILMINVDDNSVNQIGTWPFSRNVYADSLRVLKELGTASVVFDLSFVDKSESKVDEDYVNETLPEYVDAGFQQIDEKVMDIMSYFADTQVSFDDAESATMEIMNTTSIVKNNLETSISYVIESQDESLAKAIKYFDSTYLTLTFDSDSEITQEQADYLNTYIALDNIEVVKDTKTPENLGLLPAIPQFMTQAKKAGFVNADPDSDGYARRVHLIRKYKGKYYGQLVFVPILEYFGNPKVVVTNSLITLKNCRFPNMEIKDIKIPRGQDGAVLIKYPKSYYVDYNNVSLWNIYRLALLEDNIEYTVQSLYEQGYFDYYEGENDPYECLSNATYIQDALYNQDQEFTFDMYRAYKTDFLTAYGDFLNGQTMEYMLADYEGDEESQSAIKEAFDASASQFNQYIESRNKINDIVRNSMCIVGTCSTSTTDYGLNQYEEHYPNPGIHYVLANMLYSQDFVDDAPAWISLLLALIICLGYSFATHKIKSTGRQIIIGISALAATIIIFLLVFIISKKYIGLVVPLISLLASFIITTVVGFVTASHDKRFITNAFSQCLSPEVVDEIVANPSSFKLGGQRLEMTAMFTDIQKFSSFSELLSASQLVALLNYYLTKMSDIIMAERGTVDKYEGDAIIALVGAPVKMEDHAQRACAAAIEMKKSEVEMNKEIRIMAAQDKPADMDEDLYTAFKIMVDNNKKIFTRIGLNSGEMIAGYMGSENKKNYTMMGNNVNLASRLEGVNKQYHTGGIMISEATRNLLGDRFLVRSLDRVRVVNVNTPIRLYELIDEKSLVKEEDLAYYERWEEAHKIFESRDYAQALEKIEALVKERPSDTVASYYKQLISNYFIKGKFPTEKDDAGVAFNDEEFVFKLLQK
ncbi:MAG: adenylate/guanylate cyclase domain-containing protein [Treponema sp.]|nr:adenylate/guanylate cyclase domain-containing protein [Treponema sp.]